MGADLYLRSEYDKNQEVWRPKFEEAVAERDKAFRGSPAFTEAQKKVEEYFGKLHEVGYFRDSYNDSSLLWTLGLSWWEDVAKNFVNKKGNIPVTKAKKLLELVESRQFVKLPTPDSEWSREEIGRYFVEKKQHFVSFLKRAIELKEEIEASV